MPLLDTELARREGPHLVCSNRPVRIACELTDLTTADGFGICCKFAASVRVGPAAADRVMVGEVLLANRSSVDSRQLGGLFAAALAPDAARAAGDHDAGWWLGKDGPPAMLSALRKAGEAFAFRGGLELLEPMSADLASPDYQKQQLFARQARLAEQRAAEQLGHLHRSAELLREFQALRESAPQLSPGAVLDRLAPADRGSILQSLLQGSASGPSEPAQRLFAVAGTALAEIDPVNGAATPILHPLPDILGPLRSVQSATVSGNRRLLVGARGGFYVIDPNDPRNGQRYAMIAAAKGNSESGLGFNRVLYRPGSGFWATHAELGLVNWAEDDGSAPRQVFGPAYLNIASPASPSPLPTYSTNSISITTAGPRHLAGLGDAMIFSVGSRLYRFSGSSASPVALPSAYGANIAAVVSDGSMIAAVFEDGSVWTPDPANQWVCRAQRGTAICAAGLLPWLGSARLLLATLNGPIDCIGLDDPLVTQYAGPSAAGCRALAASVDWVAAISRDRQRLLLWHTWEGARPAAEIYLGVQAHHRIADVAFA